MTDSAEAKITSEVKVKKPKRVEAGKKLAALSKRLEKERNWIVRMNPGAPP